MDQFMSPPRRRLAIVALEDRTVPVAGALDSTFSGDGTLVLSIPGYSATEAQHVLVQPDGKILAAGQAVAGGVTHPALFRFNTDGTPDTTFDGDGFAIIDVPGGSGGFSGATLQPDGKVVATGGALIGGNFEVLVVRFNVDGSLDSTFDDDGIVLTDASPEDDGARAVALQPDGKVVVVGSDQLAVGSNVTDFLAVRYLPDGSLDTSFDGDGIARVNLGNSGAVATAVLVQADGRVVAAGTSSQSSGNFGFALVRFNTDGSLDTSFDGDGIVLTQPPGFQFEGVRDITQLPDGRLLAAGDAGVGGGVRPTPVLLMYDPDGSLDPTFDGDGMVVTDLPGNGGEITGMAVQVNGKIVASGGLSVPGGLQSIVMRYLKDGSPDTGFGPAGTVVAPGVVATDLAPGNNDEFLSVALDPLGNVVAAGTIGNSADLTLARYLGDPPTTVGDQYATDEDVPLHVAAPGVLANDTVISSSFHAQLVQGPAHAPAFTFNPDGSFDYMPAANYNGTDSFTYRLVGGTVSSPTATVNLTIHPVNDPPVAADDAYQLPRLVPPTLSVAAGQGVLANDTDVEGDPLTAILVSPPAQGNLDFHADGSFEYTFPSTLIGSVTFTYKANDGLVDGPPATVTLTRPPDQPPVAADDAYQLPRLLPPTISVAAGQGVLANDTDAEGDPLTAILVSPPAQGTLDFHADGSFDYAFPRTLIGSVTFTYKANDGLVDGPPATVTFTRPPDQPPAAANDSYALPFASPVAVPAGLGVLANDSDAEGDPITLTLVSPPAVGTLTFNADGSFSYAFPPDLTGPVTFTYQVADPAFSGNTATVTLTRQGLTDVSNGKLTIIGTGGSDVFRLRPAGTGIAVEEQTALGLTRSVFHAPRGTPRIKQIEIDLGPGNDRLDATALRLPVRVVGGAGDDVIQTGSGADTIFGDATDGTGTGVDVIESGAGNDTVTAGSGGSFIDAGAGNDLVTVIGGSNWVQGGAGNDVLLGGTGADVLEGGAGKDLLVGGLGADILDGGNGNDILFDGTVAVANPGSDSLAAILAAYVPTRKSVLANLSARLSVTPDTAAVDSLTGGVGTDWFWSADGLDVLDVRPNEPHNAVA
jgi:uncharacterized delta-60 repeat protein